MTGRAIALVYFVGCPNVERTRSNLRAALGALGLPATWREFTSDAPDLPASARGYGSPTILVDGRDILGAGPSDSPDSCRLYPPGLGDHGAPSVRAIVAALHGDGASSDDSPVTDSPCCEAP